MLNISVNYESTEIGLYLHCGIKMSVLSENLGKSIPVVQGKSGSL